MNSNSYSLIIEWELSEHERQAMKENQPKDHVVHYELGWLACRRYRDLVGDPKEYIQLLEVKRDLEKKVWELERQQKATVDA